MARLGSFSRAATELGINQATVSRRIDQLEAAAGVPLFIRRSTGTALTPAGRRLAEASESTAKSIDNFNRIFRSIADEEPPLTIATPEGLQTYFIGPILSGMAKQVVPEAIIKAPADILCIPPVLFLPLGSEADIEIVLVNPGDDVRCSPDYVVRKIGTMLFCCVASSRYLLKAGFPENYREHKTHKIITHVVYESHNSFARWREINSEIGYSPSITLTTTSALHKLLSASAGISLMPTFTPIIDPNIILLPDNSRNYTTDIWICSHPETLKLRSARRVFDLIASLFSESTIFNPH